MQARYGVNENTVVPGVGKIANRAIQMINFSPFNSSNINKTFSDLKFLKLTDFISLQTAYLWNCFEKENINPFANYFQKSCLNIPREHPVFKNFASVPKLTHKFKGKSICWYME